MKASMILRPVTVVSSLTEFKVASWLAVWKNICIHMYAIHKQIELQAVGEAGESRTNNHHLGFTIDSWA